jgi:DNA end-binding protein Ku
VLLPHEQVLMLNTLRYADEILPAKSIGTPSGSVRELGVSARELDLALKLVADMTEPWDAGAYKDTYRRDLLKRIEEKVEKGQSRVLTKPERAKPAQRGAEIIDLTALLKRSLEKKTSAKTSVKSSAEHARRRSAARHSRRPAARRRA